MIYDENHYFVFSYQSLFVMFVGSLCKKKEKKKRKRHHSRQTQRVLYFIVLVCTIYKIYYVQFQFICMVRFFTFYFKSYPRLGTMQYNIVYRILYSHFHSMPCNAMKMILIESLKCITR